MRGSTASVLTNVDQRPAQYLDRAAEPMAGTEYWVVVTNVAGSTNTSHFAALPSTCRPSSRNSRLNVTTNAGQQATFSVTISTNSTLPLSYQWWFNTGVLTNLLTNATSADVDPDERAAEPGGQLLGGGDQRGRELTVPTRR